MSAASYEIRSGPAGSTIAFAGDWTALTLGDAALALRGDMARLGAAPRLDLGAIGKVDTAGAFAILRAVPPASAAAAAPRPEMARLFDLVAPAIGESAAPAAVGGWLIRLLDRIGRGVAAFGDEVYRACVFAGRLFAALGGALRRPRRLRGIALAHAMETAGADALPIILVMNFFIGTVVALVGANLLTSLGVDVYVVELVGVAVLREFAVLFTAILLAGRSASSFAAQIGTMKMNQEIDAMKVMGVDPFDALVVPRVLALIWMMPLLSFAAMAAGLTGGMLVSWAALDMSPVFFVERLKETVPARHFWIGMSKTPLLALLIAMAGCRHGLFVAGDVESLGSRVTMAVVQAIFMIILFDAIFALIYMELKL